VRLVLCRGAGGGGLVEEDADLLHAAVQDWPDPLRNESYPMDLSGLEELEGGSTGRRAREREKAPPPAACCPSNAATRAPQREGEGIAERVEEDGEKRESDCGDRLGMRGEGIIVFLYSERGCIWAVCRPINYAGVATGY
jgi:hypothetical protein